MAVGQIVGRMNQVRPVADVIPLLREADEALDWLGGLGQPSSGANGQHPRCRA
jgi:hypothetical protein